MAIVDVKVPQLSESVSEGTLVEWKKRPGESVAIDEILVEIETDKVVLEVPAPVAGVIAQLVRSDGASVASEEVIAKIDTEAAESVSPLEVKAVSETTTPPPVAPAVAGAKSDIAMPSAAKLMADNRMDPGSVAGSGRDGRVTKGDVLGALEGAVAPAVRSAPPRPSALPLVGLPPSSSLQVLSERPEQRVPMSRLRARVAERLLHSQATAAILTTFNEVNMAPVMEMRKRFQERFEKEHGVKIGFMSFFVKAAVAALKKFPVINASVDGNDIVYHGYFDIGIAVGSPRGLVVPILRNADQMSFAEIEKKIAEFGQKAKDGKLALDDLSGGTFSISNGGVFGSMLSTPIINPPQSAILGVHATKDRAVVENGQIVVRPMNYLAMSYDHRIIDGREAVLGLVAMKEALEDPARLLFDI